MIRRHTSRTPDSTHDIVEASATAMLGQILDRLSASRDGERIVPWCRVRDLTPPRGPFSKATVLRMLNRGELRAVRVGGMLLVSIDSVRELLDRAEPWRPR